MSTNTSSSDQHQVNNTAQVDSVPHSHNSTPLNVEATPFVPLTSYNAGEKPSSRAHSPAHQSNNSGTAEPAAGCPQRFSQKTPAHIPPAVAMTRCQQQQHLHDSSPVNVPPATDTGGTSNRECLQESGSTYDSLNSSGTPSQHNSVPRNRSRSNSNHKQRHVIQTEEPPEVISRMSSQGKISPPAAAEAPPQHQSTANAPPAKATPPPRRVMKPVPTNPDANRSPPESPPPASAVSVPKKYRINPYAHETAFQSVSSPTGTAAGSSANTSTLVGSTHLAATGTRSDPATSAEASSLVNAFNQDGSGRFGGSATSGGRSPSKPISLNNTPDLRPKTASSSNQPSPASLLVSPEQFPAAPSTSPAATLYSQSLPPSMTWDNQQYHNQTPPVHYLQHQRDDQHRDDKVRSRSQESCASTHGCTPTNTLVSNSSVTTPPPQGANSSVTSIGGGMYFSANTTRTQRPVAYAQQQRHQQNQQQKLSYQSHNRSSTPPPVWKADPPQPARPAPGLASIDLDDREEGVVRHNLAVHTPPADNGHHVADQDTAKKDFRDAQGNRGRYQVEIPQARSKQRDGMSPQSESSTGSGTLRYADMVRADKSLRRDAENAKKPTAATYPRRPAPDLKQIRLLPSIPAVDAASIGQHSSSSPKKKQPSAAAATKSSAAASTTHILHKALLGSQVSFYPFPSEAELQAMANDPAFTTPKVPKEEMARVFLGQLPYETSEVLVQWIADKLAGGIKLHHVEKITKLERVVGSERYGTKIPTGCFHACVAHEEVGKMLVGLHKKILVDGPGLWVADFPGAVGENMLPLYPTPNMPKDLLTPPGTATTGYSPKTTKQHTSAKALASDFPSIGEAHGILDDDNESEVSKEAQQELRGLKMLKELRDHCYAMKLHKNLRIANRPYGAVVAQIATSTYDSDAVREAHAASEARGGYRPHREAPFHTNGKDAETQHSASHSAKGKPYAGDRVDDRGPRGHQLKSSWGPPSQKKR